MESRTSKMDSPRPGLLCNVPKQKLLGTRTSVIQLAPLGPLQIFHEITCFEHILLFRLLEK